MALPPPLPSTPSHALAGHEGAVLAVRFNRAGTYCLSCGKDRTVRLWNPHRGVAVKTYTGAPKTTTERDDDDDENHATMAAA